MSAHEHDLCFQCIFPANFSNLLDVVHEGVLAAVRVAGGDWGGIAVYALGALHTENVAAIHSNMAICSLNFFSPRQLLQVVLLLLANF